MGTIVIGLLTHTKVIESKILAEKTTASTAAKRVWRGSGRKAQKRPIANALEIVCLFHFHKLGSCKCYLANLN